ncbi:hypothetical protein DSL72_001505 [Monilinia vaccinii-corymbosi]|uniref:Dynamin N-terminal domain-containing protein n=1 Tax=Monilinia vaccinii-corymbosi TaxID=61207 RepID=A0A8A3P7H6_9HELO|nr:hypothetical protein DSL72_001505 [Monilinia vaccinii-corymbosi]
MSLTFPSTSRLQNLRNYPYSLLSLLSRYGVFDMAMRAVESLTKISAEVDYDDNTISKTIQMLRKENSVEDGSVFLKEVSKILRQHTKLFPEFQQWIEETDEILAQTERPRVLIGLLGITGCGKSSLINALLDEEIIVPVNAMRACTSVAIEISWNSTDDSKQLYRAEIEFISTDEWKAEIDILLSDLASAASGGKISTKSAEARSAWAKISAVYSQVEVSRLSGVTAETLLLENDLSSILGSTKKVCAENAKAFSAAVNIYIDNNNKLSNTETMAYWPLVRCVRLYVKAKVLRHGLVLVDLPGLGDSNPGRKQVAEKYLRRLSYIWIVADIVRAVDDQIAKELLGTSFRRQLLMDGKYDNDYVTFVLSKTDIMSTDEVIDSLELAEDTLKSHLERERLVRAEIRDTQKSISVAMATVRGLDDQIRELDEQFTAMKPTNNAKKRGRKRKLDEDCVKTPDESLKEHPEWTALVLREKTQEKTKLTRDKTKEKDVIKDLKGTLSERKATQKSIENEIKNICTQARNDYTKDQTRIALDVSTQNKLNIFCVSSKGYQRLCGRFKRDPIPKAFPTLRETFIPDLQDYAECSTVRVRMKIADEFLNGVKLLKMTMKSWAENGMPISLTSSKKDELEKMLGRHLEKFNISYLKASGAVMAELRNHMNSDILPVIKTSVKASVEGSEET